MPLAGFVFSETTPAAVGTAVSSQPVASAASWAPAGVAAPLDDYDSIAVDAELIGATGDTLDVYLQGSPDQGLSWYDIIHWTQLSAGHAAVIYSSPISQSTTTAAPVAVGKNLAPALTAGTVVNGSFTDRFRLVFVAGASTSQGAKIVVRLAPQRSRVREAGGSS
jgi:hypothetical protein